MMRRVLLTIDTPDSYHLFTSNHCFLLSLVFVFSFLSAHCHSILTEDELTTAVR